MGLLEKLWDDTVAGPMPDAGLGRLRRHPTFSSSIRSARQQEELTVTRSITIVRTLPRGGADSGSLPSSPASGADSPFTPSTPKGEEWRRTRRRPPEAAVSEAFQPSEPRSPTVYDWVVISSLDR